VVLLGDAAYAVSLLAGQGASLAVAGASVLARALTSGASLDAAFQAYETTLRPVVSDVQERAHRGARWFVPATPAQRWLRRIALRAAGLPLADRVLASALVGKPSALRFTGTDPVVPS
jgi:2-polyprenyl-6-methoxyphenol hydroxylase-like FAD-dependent oxidoreductase